MKLTSDDDDTLQFTARQANTRFVVTDWAARSSVGLIRTKNEDAWGESDGRVFAVADGMGGTDGGQRASTLAIAGFLSADPSDGWLAAIESLNSSVRERCDEENMYTAGTTLVGVIVEAGRCVTISVGDSRIYRLRNNELEQLTSDHNLGNLRIEEGLDPRAHDERGKPGALTSYLGNPDREQRVDVGTVSSETGDRLLLCSDGVHNQVASEDIVRILQGGTCQDVAERLVFESDNAGGRDNATALVVELGRETS